MSTEIELPPKELLTIGWLLNHVPISWWVIFVTLIVTSFSAGFAARGLVFTKDATLLERKSLRLSKEVHLLKASKLSLELEIKAINIRNQEITPDVAAENLRKRIGS